MDKEVAMTPDNIMVYPPLSATVPLSEFISIWYVKCNLEATDIRMNTLQEQEAIHACTGPPFTFLPTQSPFCLDL